MQMSIDVVPEYEHLNSSFRPNDFAFMRKPPSFTIFAFTIFTCVHALIAMEIFYYMRGWKSPTKMASDIDAMFFCIFNLCDVRMRIAITFIVPSGYLRGPL